MIRIKRVYDAPASADGHRILVERLWPRGVKKDALGMNEWRKEVAPSTQLRQWFGHKPERWDEFRRRYDKELSANGEGWSVIADASKKGTVTLLYSAHDTEHNSAVVLRDFLGKRTRRQRTPNRKVARVSTSASKTRRARGPKRTSGSINTGRK